MLISEWCKLCEVGNTLAAFEVRRHQVQTKQDGRFRTLLPAD